MISFYRNAKDASSQETILVDTFLHDVKQGKWKDSVEAYRATHTGKELLPMVTISGYFSHRQADKIVKHSGFICLDLDKIPTDEITSLFDRICTDKYTYSCFRSVGGQGIAVVVKIDGTRHTDAFEGLQRYYADTFQIAIDRSCRDVTRSRFVTYDPYLWKNEKSVVFKAYIPKKEVPRNTPPPIFTSKDFNNIIDHIESTGTDITQDSYDVWFRIGFALADEFKEEGRAYFHSVSQFSSKYSPAVCDRQYTNCLKSRGTGIHIGTFFHLCKLAKVPINSTETARAIRVVEQAKKQNRTKESAVRTLTEVAGMDALEATEIVDKAFERPYTPEPSGNPIETIELFIQANYTLRHNLITGKVENNGRPLTDIDTNSMFIALKRIDPKVSNDLFQMFVRSDNVPSYNPLREYLEANSARTPQGAIDAIADCITGFNGYLPSGEYVPDFVRLFIRKFYLGLIAGALGDEVPPIVPILWGKEIGTGKTEFWKRLLPPSLSGYFASSALENGKDDDILLCQKWIVCDDEWGGKLSRDAKLMKAKAGQATFSHRRAYGRETEDFRRIAMLCGTSNDSDLLTENSNRRIVPIHAQSIDLDRYYAIDKTDALIEAYHLYTSAGEVGFLTPAENKLLNEMSKRNTSPDWVAETILKYYSPGEPGTKQSEQMTATEITAAIQTKIPAIKLFPNHVGRAMSKMDFLHTTTGGVRYYWVIIADTRS